jgi:hypothetical protein
VLDSAARAPQASAYVLDSAPTPSLGVPLRSFGICLCAARGHGVLNCGHARVRSLILDSLRHWAEEYQVDGFCFVNAETLVQGA